MANSLGYFEISKKKSLGGWFYKLLLFVSFLFIDFYIESSSAGIMAVLAGKNLIGSTNTFMYVLGLTAVEALIDWLILELILWLYRTILAFKIYSFVVPEQKLKNECRMFFAIKNFVLAIIVNLCFEFPYLYSFIEFFNIFLLLIMLVVFAWYVQKKYSQPLISHFVFKCFCYPVFLFECIVLLISYLGVVI